MNGWIIIGIIIYLLPAPFVLYVGWTKGYRLIPTLIVALLWPLFLLTVLLRGKDRE